MSSMLSSYQPPSAIEQENEPYRHQPNVYPFAHIHATNNPIPAPSGKATRAASNKKGVASVTKMAQQQQQQQPLTARPMTGPVTKQKPGYGPYHSTVVRPEQKRLDFSRPRTIAGRPVSELDERAGSRSEVAELAPGDTIRLFTSTQRKIQEAAVHARSYRTTAPNYVQAESNQPLSSQHVSLERFQTQDGCGSSGVLESAMQPQISASFIQKQTALRLASKAQQLEQYHHSVQERLRRKLLEQKREEERRRAQLPSKVKKLVYDMHTPGCETPVPEQAGGVPLGSEEQQQHQQHAGEPLVDHGLARMDMLPYHESAAPPSAVVQAWSQSSQVRAHPESFGSASQRARADGAHSSRESQRSVVSKRESVALMLLVRKQEMEKSRQQAQQARLNPAASSTGGQMSSRSGRSRERVAFGSALSRTPSPSAHSPPRPTPRGLICRAEERDDLHRNPRSFVVRQHTAEQEEPEDDGAVLHVGLAAAAAVGKKARMSAAVAGRRLPKKKAPRGDGSAGALEKNAAYRRLLLERLHAIAQSLQHPLPPLCACGFTAKEEYELLFSFQGAVPNAPIAPSQPPPGHLPFNLSTIISQQQQQPASASSIRAAAASQPQLPAHVSVDSTRHAFQHKHNCNFYNAPDAYIKALANLLHTLEDQQQI